MGFPVREWLGYYAGRFDTVELNSAFYRLPSVAAYEGWRAQVSSRFRFAVKASRFLTHMKKLKDPEEPLDRFFSRARSLGPHLGPVLYQLPPGWKLDRARLEYFLRSVPRDVPQVIEFRDPTWYAPEVYALLERHRVSLCLHDMPGSATGRLRVGPCVYVRFHGASGRYDGSYPDEHLANWADWLQQQARAGADVYAYFNNDVGGHAPRNALVLRRQMTTVEAVGA